MYIEFDVRQQIISRTDNIDVVANSQNFLYARFTFSEEWEGLQHNAVFSTNSGTAITVILQDGECLVPWEVLRGREFFVGVFAGDRVTSTLVRVPVKESVNVHASPGVQPTPTAYEMLVERVEDALRKGPHIGDNDNWWVWDTTVNDFVDTGVYSHGDSPRVGVNGNWWIGNDDTGARAAGVDGIDGKDGNSIRDITRTAGTGAPGTIDTYTVTLTDGSTTSFNVYNGADGMGAGDMTAIVYDPQGKKTDVFKAIDDAVSTVKGSIEIPSGADLNDYKTPGDYYKNSGAEYLANYPSAYGAFALKVEKNGAYGVGVTQTLKDHQGNVYVRAHAANSSSDWTEWDEIAKANECLQVNGSNSMKGILYMDDVSGQTTQRGYILEWMGNFHIRNYKDDNNFTDIVLKPGEITPTVVQVKDGVMSEYAIYHAGNLPVEAAVAEIVE